MITLVPFLLDSVLFGQEHSDQVKVADLRKRSTKCQLLAIVESKALIGETEMQQTMQRDALHQAGKALDLLDVTCVIKKQELDGISVAIISTGNIIQN
ncbi:hypothetical protein C4D60_Mb06t19310 [Musa balbisiana]|uniref:Uncharacterized protein n=1 Tax=Musa balbisiana TaxID=52838 RepID=A0A4S8IRN5_MUSBA|nr:hypothetical protein C4D60_Mb06t19310 [Musa balbisiana]